MWCNHSCITCRLTSTCFRQSTLQVVIPRALLVNIHLAVYCCSLYSAGCQSNFVVQMRQDFATEGLPCLKQQNMRQTAMARGNCIPSSKTFAAAVAAAAPSALAVAAGHHEECSKGQVTNSVCHLVESLVGSLAFTKQSEDTHMLVV